MSEHQFYFQGKRWAACLGRLSCFTASKGRKRIVPASRLQSGNTPSGHQNGATRPDGPVNHTAGLASSLLAPPSSPASFMTSAIHSTAGSPCSRPSPSPSRSPPTMFATGPYAHETQLVSPPVFSTFTTEPSTASLTPPPELCHITTPSSPDVPFARFLSSCGGRSLAGAASPTSPDGNFFSPATYARFYTDDARAAAGGRLSLSREGNQEAEETEAYRVSFGFSADEVVAAPPPYVEAADGADISFAVAAVAPAQRVGEEREVHPFGVERGRKWPDDGTWLAEGKPRRGGFHLGPDSDQFSPAGYMNSGGNRSCKYWSSDAEIDYGNGSRGRNSDH